MMQQPYTTHTNPTRARISCYNTSSPFLGANITWFSTSKLTFFLTSIPKHPALLDSQYRKLCNALCGEKGRWPPCKTNFHWCLVQAAALNRLPFTILLAWDMALALLTFPRIWGGSLMTDAACASETSATWHTHERVRAHTHTHTVPTPTGSHQYWTKSESPLSIIVHPKQQWNTAFVKKLHILSLLLHRASCRLNNYHKTNKCTNCM